MIDISNRAGNIVRKGENAGAQQFQRFGLSQTSPCFLCVCSRSLLKTLREKEKLLVASNFSISHSVYYLFSKLSTIFIKFKLSSANSFSWVESNICLLAKG